MGGAQSNSAIEKAGPTDFEAFRKDLQKLDHHRLNRVYEELKQIMEIAEKEVDRRRQELYEMELLEEEIKIELFSNDPGLGNSRIEVRRGQHVGDAIQAAYVDLVKEVVVSMGGTEIDMELSFLDNDIEDGARLDVMVIEPRDPSLNDLNDFIQRVSTPPAAVEAVKDHLRSTTFQWTKGKYLLGGHIKLSPDEPITPEIIEKVKEKNEQNRYGYNIFHSNETANFHYNRFKIMQELIEQYKRG